MLRCLFVCFACLLALPVLADRDQRERWTMNAYVENDLFSETDQYYTSGVRFSWVSPDINDYVENEALPGWVKELNERLTYFHRTHDNWREGIKRNVVVTLGQQIFTPEDEFRTDLIEDDRPYAGWLFLGLGYQTRSADRLDTLDIRFGIVGPAALGQEAQDFIHDLRGFSKFQGWDNQLRNEPGFIADWEHKRKLSFREPGTRFSYDWIGHGGLAIGNVSTHANAGGEFRVGWGIPDDFGTSALRAGGENSTPDSSWDPRIVYDRMWGLHAFASFDLQLVGHNIFLDGNTFRDSHSVPKETFVAEAALGLSFTYGGGRVSYAHIFRTKEYAYQRRSHSYGSLAVSYTF